MRVGLDVGGTKIEAVALGDDAADSAAIIGRVRLATTPGEAGVVASIAQALSQLTTQLDVALDAITSVGIGIPGMIEPGTTIVRHSVNLGVEELDLGAALRTVLPARVRADNDVKAAAVGAYALRGGLGSMAYLNLGTGVAAGIILDGELLGGARGGAGEVGHLSVDPQGPRCRCGQLGCVEAYVGGAALAERWGATDPYPVRHLFDAADAGDPRAITLRDGAAFGAAAAVRSLMLSVDVETVVIGGGLSALGDRLLTPIRERLRIEGETSPFLHSLELGARMELLPAGSPAAALGAALIGADEMREGALTHG
ncbi:ROK family protein [Microbacterium nymphoidis]|uniref:ROK family protein n=1 Tax=Microbacterium nymphoidis TaxID=2898586 RepID=UPI001E516FBF|nr:ROK family protein [Microbacterium nymphoidis]MCD2497664.1 ROK family protein [Microbacterium nymphoidis]